MATVAVFLALGGGTYAATQLRKNSVGTKQVKNGAIIGSKIADGAVSQSKIDSSAQSALRSGPAGGALAGSYPNPRLAPPEQIHEVADSDLGSCSPGVQWKNQSDSDANFPKLGFFRDPFGVVHLRGAVRCPGFAPVAADGIFSLPPGYTPPLAEIFAVAGAGGPTEIQVTSNGLVLFQGTGFNPGASSYLALDGISFRCEPSGVSGCP